eukprot:scaffold2520_cov17-Tisochrysis_lutea.AAC.1
MIRGVECVDGQIPLSSQYYMQHDTYANFAALECQSFEHALALLKCCAVQGFAALQVCRCLQTRSTVGAMHHHAYASSTVTHQHLRMLMPAARSSPRGAQGQQKAAVGRQGCTEGLAGEDG